MGEQAPDVSSRALTVASWFFVACAVLVVPFLDAPDSRALITTTVVLWGAFGLAVFGLYCNRPARGSGWYEAAGAVCALALGDTLTLLLVGRAATLFLPAVGCYLLGYVLGGIALVRLMWRWSSWQQLSVVIDSLTMLVGVATVIAAIIWMHAGDPVLRSDPTLVAFPVLDLLVVGAVGRYWFSPGGRARSVQILCCAVLVLVASHIMMLLRALNPTGVEYRWTQLWLLALVTIAVAVAHPSSRRTSHDAPGEREGISVASILGLILSAALPPLVLLAFGLAGAHVPWVPIGIGGLASIALLGARLGLMVRDLRSQTERIQLLASSDWLTGAANRRVWDLRLAEAMASGRRYWALLIDLDEFKKFNDSHGHVAGDDLLRRSVGIWRDQLDRDVLLARYGGEEFTVLLPDQPRSEAARVADALRQSMPMGQTCSIGLAYSGSYATPDALLRAADDALYGAKRSGRNRIVFADPADHAIDTPPASAPANSAAGEPASLPDRMATDPAGP